MSYQVHITVESVDLPSEKLAEDLAAALTHSYGTFEGFDTSEVEVDKWTSAGFDNKSADTWLVAAREEFDNVTENEVLSFMEMLSVEFKVTLTMYYSTDDPDEFVKAHVGPNAKRFEVEDIADALLEQTHKLKNYTAHDFADILPKLTEAQRRIVFKNL